MVAITNLKDKWYHVRLVPPLSFIKKVKLVNRLTTSIRNKIMIAIFKGMSESNGKN